VPVQNSAFDDQNPPVSQAVQIWAEGSEIVPYAAGFTRVSAMVPGFTGLEAVSVSDDVASSTQEPTPYNLSWTAGDTAQFDFFFDGVAWTNPAPADLHGLTWVKTVWEAQARSGAMLYYGYWWPPVWPGRWPTIVKFDIWTEVLADYNSLGPGTMVHLSGGAIWPGTFKWDLQTKQFADNVTTLYKTRTWLSGDAVIAPQTTQDDLYPPSNWGTYPYA
jgi:hypothetical protein